jgi:hypothetical protein
MRADGNMRIELPNEFDQWSGIEAVKHEAHTVRFPRFIALLIPPPEEIWRILDQAGVKL